MVGCKIMVLVQLIILFLSIQHVSNKQIIKNNLIFRNADHEANDVSNISTNSCSKQISHIFWHMNENWAIKLLDASSKFSSGVLSGNIIELGSFSECLSIKYNYENDTILGNYCKVQIPTSKLINILKFFNRSEDNISSNLINGLDELDINNIIVLFAICVPNFCGEPELNDILKGNIFDISVLNCQTKDVLRFDAADIAAILFYFFVLLLIFCCSVLDYYCQYVKKDTHIIIEAFSTYSNLKKLYNLKEKSNELKCLHGIKSLSMLWIILGHTYHTSFFSPTVNSLDIVKWYENIFSMIPLGATMAVDTFFLLSGLLTCYIYLSLKIKGQKFNIYAYYFHRYIRLTPALIAVIIFHATLIKYISSGPYWPEVMKILNETCVKYWWSALLYIQNYVNPTEMCIVQSWYLSVDMQLFILTPLILLPIGKWPNRTIYFLIFSILISIIISGMFAWKYEISGFIIDAMMNDNTISVYYYNTLNRFGPMLVGIIIGYVVCYKDQFKGFNLLLENKYFSTIGFVTSSAILCLIIFGQNNIHKHDYNSIESSIYLGTHRIAWCIALSWIIYICVAGYGGMINTFLSLPMFQILSRLTYSMYLTHFSLQWINIGRLQSPIYFDNYQNIYHFCADLVVTLILSTILTLTFESPLIAIEKHYLYKKIKNNSNL